MPIELEAFKHSDIAPSSSADDVDWSHRRGGPDGCARTSAPLADLYELAWAAELPAGLDPSYLLASAGAVFVVGADLDRVAMYRDGKLHAEFRGSPSEWAIDSQQQCLLGTGPAGTPAVWDLREVDRRYTLLGHLKDSRHAFRIVADRLWIAAHVLPRLGGRRVVTDIEAYSIVDLRDANTFHIVRPRGTPALGAVRVLDRHSVQLAVGPRGPAVAVDDGLHWLQPGMGVAQSVPLDESEPAPCFGLAVHATSWAELRHAGDRVLFRSSLGDAPPTKQVLASDYCDAAPPLPAARDHWMVIASRKMALLRPNGQIVWERDRVGPPGGLTATRCSAQAWAEEDRLLAVGPDGGRVLVRLEDPLVTAPIAASESLYVASKTRLFGLRAK